MFFVSYTYFPFFRKKYCLKTYTVNFFKYVFVIRFEKHKYNMAVLLWYFVKSATKSDFGWIFIRPDPDV